jgi:hypothetical protein
MTKTSRLEQKRNDKSAAIKEVWDMFIACCKMFNTPSDYYTVDEHLLGFCGHCPFSVHIQKKPNKYVVKIVALCDGKSFYMVNATPYTGQVEKSTDDSVPAYYVKTLRGPIHGTERNVTCTVGSLLYCWLKVYLQIISQPLWVCLEKTRDTTKFHITLRRVGTVTPACISWTTDTHSKEQKCHAPFNSA